MNATKIEYLDFTWSPLVGCSGLNCAVRDKCWAKYQAKRQLNNCKKCYDFIPHKHFERLLQPSNVKSTQKIGVCFSADFWDSGFLASDRWQIFNVVKANPQHWFINLTKQPQNIGSIIQFPNNWIQGVSVNLRKDLWRIQRLKETKAVHKAVSFEPLYEFLGSVNLVRIDWIVIGAQTHPLIKPQEHWVDALITQAQAGKIPVFTKNNLGGWGFKEYPEFIKSEVFAL